MFHFAATGLQMKLLATWVVPSPAEIHINITPGLWFARLLFHPSSVASGFGNIACNCELLLALLRSWHLWTVARKLVLALPHSAQCWATGSPSAALLRIADVTLACLRCRPSVQSLDKGGLALSAPALPLSVLYTKLVSLTWIPLSWPSWRQENCPETPNKEECSQYFAFWLLFRSQRCLEPNPPHAAFLPG